MHGSAALDDRLWRIRADGGAPPERVEMAGRGVAWPSTTSSRDRLVFPRFRQDPAVYRLPLGGSPTPLIESALAEYFAQYSPDGRPVAFQSNRAENRYEIWLADADGSNPTRLTRGPGQQQDAPSWSPDGRSIAFSSQAESGRFDVWATGVDGSGLHRLTHDPGDERTPSWSRDGRLLYFESNRTGRFEIWRTAAGGGADAQVTHEGGRNAQESLDGRTVYYMRSNSDALLARPTAGGQERTILRCVDGWNYAVGPRGVLYVECQTPNSCVTSQQVLRHWDAATGKDQPVATLEANSIWGLSVSPDGRSILYGRNQWTSDLMMIENFR